MTAWLAWKLKLSAKNQPNLEATLREQKRRGFAVPELDGEPKLDSEHAWIIAAFMELSARGRPPSFEGAAPIALARIVAYMDEEGIRSPEIRREFRAHIAALDNVYLEHGRKAA